MFTFFTTIAPVDENIWKFTVGGGLPIAGLSVFLPGAEAGLIPIGQAAGAALTGMGIAFSMPATQAFSLEN